jgi:hypothetical protein
MDYWRTHDDARHAYQCTDIEAFLEFRTIHCVKLPKNKIIDVINGLSSSKVVGWGNVSRDGEGKNMGTGRDEGYGDEENVKLHDWGFISVVHE